MLRNFIDFETRFWFGGFMVWIFLIVIATMILGAATSDQVTVGGSIGNTLRNAPYVIQNFYAITSILTLLMTTAFANSAAIRDFQYNTHQLIFSLPVKKWDYILGRYIGSSLAALLPSLGVSIAMLMAPYMSWADAERFGGIAWHAHLNSLLVFAIPNTLFISAILFSIALLFRSTTVSFLAALIILVGFGVTDAMTQDMKNETLAAMLDPFGTRAFSVMTKYWTVSDRNTLSMGLTGLLLWNRLLWLAVGGLIFGLVSSQVTMGERQSRKKKPQVVDEEPAVVPQSAAAISTALPKPGEGSVIAQLIGTFKVEFGALVKTPTFVVILAAAMLNCVGSLIGGAGEMYGNKSFPVTYNVIEIIRGTLYMFLVAIITFFAGQLVWKEREERVDEIQDCLPIQDWILYAAKMAVLLVSIVFVLSLSIGSGMAVQAFKGYTRFQPDVYFGEVYIRDFSQFIFLSVLAFFFHLVTPNKFIGYFAFVAYLIADAFGWQAADVATKMLDFGSRPVLPYSDFYGFAPAATGWRWFTLYWGLFCSLVAVASVLLWRRGKEISWPSRFRIAGERFSGAIKPVSILLVVAFVGTAGWVFYNTKVLNTIVGPKGREQMSGDYEKLYKKYQKIPLPRITTANYEIDLYPETREMTMRGVNTLVNKTGGPINDLHYSVENDYETEIQIPGAKLTLDDKVHRYRIYKLATPFAAGDSMQVRFTVKAENKGFSNSVLRQQIVQNGTFFNNTVGPILGYDENRELSDRNQRRKQGLKEKDLMPALEANCTAHCMDTYLGGHSDWTSVETVISTSGDQTAVAPGSLIKKWTANGRNYAQYRLDHDSLNFYSFISAKYKVERQQHNGIELEVYSLPEHYWNVPRMFQSMKKSLDYYTANFGPYYHKQARIIEFPRIARFAQAFPGTMPYSEAIGFIADLKDPEDIDMVFYVVAHEMGHQWWAHQVVGADMQGATLTSETMAQYSALMVMEKEYGRDQMRKFLEYEMDRYLRSRGREALKERPLIRVEASQGYIHYNKGSLILYYLKEMIGEEAVNRALRKMIEKYGYAQPPYPTSQNLVDLFAAETPAEYKYLIKDLFEEITLFSNRTSSAKAKKLADGRYEVTIEAEAKKFKADEKGAEKEVAVNDWIEVGAFAKPPKGKKYGQTLYRERLHITGPKFTKTFVVKELPEKAGIDPFHLLVDRISDDNTKAVEVN